MRQIQRQHYPVNLEQLDDYSLESLATSMMIYCNDYSDDEHSGMSLELKSRM